MQPSQIVFVQQKLIFECLCTGNSFRRKQIEHASPSVLSWPLAINCCRRSRAAVMSADSTEPPAADTPAAEATPDMLGCDTPSSSEPSSDQTSRATADSSKHRQLEDVCPSTHRPWHSWPSPTRCFHVELHTAVAAGAQVSASKLQGRGTEPLDPALDRPKPKTFLTSAALRPARLLNMVHNQLN